MYELIGAVLVIAVTSLTIVFFFYPEVLAKWINNLTRWSAGVKRKTVNVGNLTWVYQERGTPQLGVSSLIMVHGFSGSRDEWNFVIRKLPQSLHIVAVDLPGHGETDPDPDEEMKKPYDYYTSSLNQMLQNIGLGKQPVHMIGQSMGGAVVGIYSANFPEHVKGVSMLCPAMQTPKKSKLTADSEAKGKKQGSPETLEEMMELMDFCMYKRPPVPSFVFNALLRSMFEAMKKRRPFFKRLITTVTEKTAALNENIARISAPVNIIWGEEDFICDPSGAEVLRNGVQNCVQQDLIPECGHAITGEIPDIVVEKLLKFRNGFEK